MIAIVLARRIVVFIVAGEREEQHTTVFLLGIVYPCRNKLNLYLLGVLAIVHDTTAKEIDGLQTAGILIVNVDTACVPLYNLLTADGTDYEVSVAVGGIEQLVDAVVAVVLTVPSAIWFVGVKKLRH